MLAKTKAIKLAGLQLANPVMNAACPKSKTVDDVKTLAVSATGAVVVGSITIKPRNQNPGKVWYQDPSGLFALNSYGLPNGGLPYYRQHLRTMVELAHKNQKPLIANVIGFSADEFCRLVKLAQQSGADMVELNFGCPNVWGKTGQKRIVSYHAAMVKDILKKLKVIKPSVKLSVKVSPVPPDILGEISQVIVESGIIDVITACNTFPNATFSQRNKSVIDPGGGLAGLSGPALKPISLGIIKQLRQTLPKQIDLIGVGGVTIKNDVKEYLGAGAQAVQVATAFMQTGPSIFKHLQ